MRTLFYAAIVMTILSMTACSKSNSIGSPNGNGNDTTGNGTTGGTSGPGSGTKTTNYPFANTEYNGISTQVSEYYQKPIAIHFNADSTVSAYSCFGWVINGGMVLYDSIRGKITKVGTDGNGGTTVAVTFKESGDQQLLTISSDKSGLTGGSISGSPAAGATQFQYVGLKLCPTTPVSVAGSWTTDSVIRDGFYEGQQYPDVATFGFSIDSTTSYLRNGASYPEGVGVKPTTAKFWQYGSRVYFYGLNEKKALLILYFGVLSADGNYMYVDTQDFVDARLPVYGDTNAPYGPDGITPVIHKEYSGLKP